MTMAMAFNDSVIAAASSGLDWPVFPKLSGALDNATADDLQIVLRARRTYFLELIPKMPKDGLAIMCRVAILGQASNFSLQDPTPASSLLLVFEQYWEGTSAILMMPQRTTLVLRSNARASLISLHFDAWRDICNFVAWNLANPTKVHAQADAIRRPALADAIAA
jgi:hypothetical protein